METSDFADKYGRTPAWATAIKYNGCSVDDLVPESADLQQVLTTLQRPVWYQTTIEEFDGK